MRVNAVVRNSVFGGWLRALCVSALMVCAGSVSAHGNMADDPKSEAPVPGELKERVERLEEPMFRPLIERYILDEILNMRKEIAKFKQDIHAEMVDRQLQTTDRAVRYSTDTVTYFFYLIVGVSTALLIMGWNSVRDIKEKVHSLAMEQVGEIVEEYETRLRAIEQQLKVKAQQIQSNEKEIEITNEVHALWLRAAQEDLPVNKIPIYDAILALRPDDIEALTYKADAALEIGEPQWAVNLCRLALKLDENNSHAFYQLACAYTAFEMFEEATDYFRMAVAQMDSYMNEIDRDPALAPLLNYPPFYEEFCTNEFPAEPEGDG